MWSMSSTGAGAVTLTDFSQFALERVRLNPRGETGDLSRMVRAQEYGVRRVDFLGVSGRRTPPR